MLGLDDTHLRDCGSFASSLVQLVLSYGCEVWRLETSSLLKWFWLQPVGILPELHYVIHVCRRNFVCPLS